MILCLFFCLFLELIIPSQSSMHLWLTHPQLIKLSVNMAIYTSNISIPFFRGRHHSQSPMFSSPYKQVSHCTAVDHSFLFWGFPSFFSSARSIFLDSVFLSLVFSLPALLRHNCICLFLDLLSNFGGAHPPIVLMKGT